MRQTKFKTQFDLEARILLEKRHLIAEQRLATCHEKRMVEFWDRATRIEEIRLPKLKEALAAFKTKTFEFVGDDRSVVIN